MPIHFRCPHCEKLLAIGTAKGGTRIHCPLCARLLTVPPRTEVHLPTTTVMPPALAPAWWMDAPPVVAPQPETSPQPPAPPAADAWWLTAKAPSAPAETALTPTPAPSVPPPLPEPLVSAPAAEPPPDLFTFEPPAKTPALDTNSTRAPARFFTLLHVLLLLGVVILSLLVLGVLFFSAP